MPATIHPTAIVDPRAQLGQRVFIGPYVVIEGNVTVGDDTHVLPHTIITGPTTIGARNRIGPASFIGQDPQFRGNLEPNSWLVIADDNVIREGASIHRSIKPGDGSDAAPASRIGSRCYFMANSHAGHDCDVADDVTLANAVLLAGHVSVGSRVFLGGGCMVHQFCRVGTLAIVGGGEIILKDIPPYAAARWHGLKAYNAIGCRRANLPRESIRAIRTVYNAIHNHRAITDALAALDDNTRQVPEVKQILEFVATSKRGITPSVHFLDKTTDDDDS